MRRCQLLLALAVVVLLLVGCKSAPKRDPDYAVVETPTMAPQPSGNGAIYQAGYDKRWFEDLRARRVGDIVTVNLVEQTDATISNSTTVTKSQGTDISNPTLFGTAPSFGAAALRSGNMDLTFGLNSSSDFTGEGDNEQSNQLTGSVTVMVTEVLPNGYLRVRGEKRIGTNGGNEYVKLSGIVRPEDIDTRNSVPSTKVADATLVYVGDGQVADANVMGWLARFFISALVPF